MHQTGDNNMQSLEQSLGLPEKLQKVTPTPAKLKRQQRKDKTIDLMLNTDYDVQEIAEQIGITRKTVYVYWNEWKQSEEAIHIDRKWYSRCNALEETNPEKAFEGLTKIKVRMTTEKKEIDKKLTLTKNVNVNVKSMLAEYEQLITITGTQKEPVPTNSSTEPIHTSQTNNQTGTVPTT
jgi:transposase-like protein